MNSTSRLAGNRFASCRRHGESPVTIPGLTTHGNASAIMNFRSWRGGPFRDIYPVFSGACLRVAENGARQFHDDFPLCPGQLNVPNAAPKFFHAWNVQRNQAGSLEPVDFYEGDVDEVLWLPRALRVSMAPTPVATGHGPPTHFTAIVPRRSANSNPGPRAAGKCRAIQPEPWYELPGVQASGNSISY